MLLVEDDRDLSGLVSTILGQAGYHPVAIADHDEIAAAVVRWRPSCVILDGELFPRGQERSWDDAIAIRRLHPDIPVLMFTGDAASLAEAIDGTSSRSVAAGFAGVVEKPFVVDELLDTVRAAVEVQGMLSARSVVATDDRIFAATLFPGAEAGHSDGAPSVALLR